MSLPYQLWLLALAVVRSVRWFLVLWCGSTIGMIIWTTSIGVPGLAEPLIRLLVQALGGLIAGFLIHEVAHLAALRIWVPEVGTIALEVTALRVSLKPRGRMTGWQMVTAATAGPGACVIAGMIVWVLPVAYGLQWWYFFHLVFLIPIFGDGRSIVRGLQLGTEVSCLGEN